LHSTQSGIASPAALAQLASRGRWQPAPHLKLIDRKLIDVAAGRISRLIVLAPPRHGKSELISHYLPSWYLGRYPTRRIILCSYDSEFAAGWGRKTRDTLIEYGPSLFGVTVRDDSSAASRFDLDGQPGGMITSGAGGPITGRGADLLVIDDPVKNHEEAYSASARERLWDWWRSVARTRLEPGAGVVLVMTRWHQDDLAGRLLQAAAGGDGEPWNLLRLPALAEDEADDPLGRQPSQALWPERYPARLLDQTRAALGSILYSAQYQGLPQPAAGAVFRREWFKEFHMLSDGAYDLGGRIVPAGQCRRFQTVDLAVSTKTTADYTVIATFAQTPHRELLLLDLERVRMEGPDLTSLLQRHYQRWKPAYIAIEKTGFQLAIVQQARRAGLPIRELSADADKIARALHAGTRMETGDVYLLAAASWREVLEDELLSFPTGAHDDIVDSLAYAATQTIQTGGEWFLEQAAWPCPKCSRHTSRRWPTCHHCGTPRPPGYEPVRRTR